MWFNPWKAKQPKPSQPQIDYNNLPRHIAIIMDGNGRWASHRGLPRTMGHRAGVEALREVVKACSRLGIEILTVYAFSTENWKRPKEEVNVLMSLLTEYLKKELSELDRNNVRINAIGLIQNLPRDAQIELAKAQKKTERNNGLILNLALNYGGRNEIVTAVKKIGYDIMQGNLKPEEIDEQIFSSYLFTAGMPDPDLLIRTSGEMRISNFLLWQLAYTEIVVIEEYWPNFNEELLLKAIQTYQQRDRRYGGLKQ